jgi:2-aminoadipate transaminase
MQRVKTILFNRGVPATESFGIGEVTEAAQAALRANGPALLQYGPSLGFGPLREWLAAHYGVGVEQVIAGNGSLQLLEFLCLTQVRPGDVVVTESPTYDRTLTLLRRHGARVIGVALDDDGPDLSRLEAVLAAERPRFLYLIPDFQNPSGTTCSAEKRRRIVALSERDNLLIVEDAPYRQLRYRGQEEPSLHSLAPDRTIHMSSFSKLVGPGPRVGYMVGPAQLIAALAKAAEDTYICPNNLAHGIAYEWCRSGTLPAQIEKLKALYAPRLDACLSALGDHLPEARVTRPEGGFFVSLTLADGVSTRAVREAALTRQVQLADGEAFFPNGGGERFLRLPFCALTPEDIGEGVRRVAEAVRERQRAAAPA